MSDETTFRGLSVGLIVDGTGQQRRNLRPWKPRYSAEEPCAAAAAKDPLPTRPNSEPEFITNYRCGLCVPRLESNKNKTTKKKEKKMKNGHKKPMLAPKVCPTLSTIVPIIFRPEHGRVKSLREAFLAPIEKHREIWPPMANARLVPSAAGGSGSETASCRLPRSWIRSARNLSGSTRTAKRGST